jgi:hypothetical protein
MSKRKPNKGELGRNGGLAGVIDYALYKLFEKVEDFVVIPLTKLSKVVEPDHNEVTLVTEKNIIGAIAGNMMGGVSGVGGVAGAAIGAVALPRATNASSNFREHFYENNTEAVADLYASHPQSVDVGGAIIGATFGAAVFYARHKSVPLAASYVAAGIAGMYLGGKVYEVLGVHTARIGKQGERDAANER